MAGQPEENELIAELAAIELWNEQFLYNHSPDLTEQGAYQARQRRRQEIVCKLLTANLGHVTRDKRPGSLNFKLSGNHTH